MRICKDRNLNDLKMDLRNFQNTVYLNLDDQQEDNGPSGRVEQVQEAVDMHNRNIIEVNDMFDDYGDDQGDDD